MKTPLSLACLLAACVPAKYADEATAPPRDTATEMAPAVEPELTLGVPSACTDPLPEPSFVEQGLDLGVDTDEFSEEAPDGHVDGPSIAVGDVNQDGLLELAVLRMENGDSHVYGGEPGGFRALPGELYPGRAGLFADMDGDNDLDLLVGGVVPYTLEVTSGLNWRHESWPALDPPEESETRSTVHDLSLADFDGDGIDDLYVVRTAVPFGDGVARNDRLLRLDPDGLEVVRDAIPSEVGLRHGFDSVTFDEDNDGDADVYLAHDHGATVGASTLLHNEGGTFVDAGDSCFCSLQVSAKGVDITDLNRDGRPDLFITGAPLNHLLSQTEGGWLDISDTSGVRDGVSHAAGWGGVFLDVDNDGHKDILLVQGDRWNPGEVILPDGTEARFDEPIHLMRQDDGTFTDIAESLNLSALGSFRSVLATDLNRDGIEDLIITQVAERTLVYLSEGCTSANWIAVDAPVGSKVSVTSASGTQTDWARVGRGYQSTARVPLHFGLGTDPEVSAINITLADGERFEFAGPYEPRQTISISR